MMMMMVMVRVKRKQEMTSLMRLLSCGGGGIDRWMEMHMCMQGKRKE